MGSKTGKRFGFLCVIVALLFAFGCAGLQTKDDRIAQLEKRIDSLEMLMGAGVGANFYPARSVDWDNSGDAAGDLDHIGSTATDDVGIVATEDNAAYGNIFIPYVLDVDGGQTEQAPFIIDSKDGGSEDWEMASIMGKYIYGGMKIYHDSSSPLDLEGTATDDADNWNGTLRINTDDDAQRWILPDASPASGDIIGTTICFYSEFAQTMSVDVNDANDTIALHGADLTAGDEIDSPGNAGDFICLVCDAAGHWITLGYGEAEWTDGDP